MAQAITASEPEPEHVEKTITLIAYARDHYANPRNFAEDFYPSLDQFKTRENVSFTRKLWVRDGENVNSQRVDESTYDALKGQITVSNGTWLTEEKQVSVDHVNSPRWAADNFMDDLVAENTPRDINGLSCFLNYKWQDDTSESHIRIRCEDVEKRDVLTHQSVRSDDNKFERDHPRMSLQYTITMDGTPEDVSMYTDEIVTPLMGALSKNEHIGKVRLSACQETVTKAGDCFDSL